MENDNKMTPLGYVEALQREYVYAALRKRIYTKPKDVQYYTRVMAGKMDAIKKAALKHNLPCMFDSTAKELAVYDQIQGGEYGGFPKFTYSPREIQESIDKQDFCRYYAPETEVEVIEGISKIRKGQCISNNWPARTVYVHIEGETHAKWISCAMVRRIF